MSTVVINLNSRDISETPLRAIFANSGQTDIRQCVAETVAEVNNLTNTRWCWSTLDNRPIKVAVIERTDDKVYLLFAKENAPLKDTAPVSPKKLFTVNELSDLADMYLGDFETPFPNPDYKGKVLGPLSDAQAEKILTILMLRNFDQELRNEVRHLARQLNP